MSEEHRSVPVPLRPGCLHDVRQWATSWVQQHRAGTDPDVVALVLTEMVTNSVRHGAPPVEVELIDRPGRLVLTVSDGSMVPPRRVAPKPDAESGRGTVLLDALTSTWGVRLEPRGGKTVWCQFDT
jgi:anti-sigma regulatory factor (Ser/Thr protein kinase)